MPVNIQKQLKHAVCECFTPGHSKRADKFNDAIDTSWKIYSNGYRKDMIDLAGDFGSFLRTQYPNIKNSYEIGTGEVQAFLEKKAATCVDGTLAKKISRLWKLEKCCMHISCSDSRKKFHWSTSDIVMPESTKEAKYKKNIPIPIEVSKEAIAAMREKRSEAVNAVTLSTYLGMRTRETTCLKVESVHFSDGEFGLGWVQIVEGPAGGAKAGKPRVIPILDREAQGALKFVVAGKKPEDYIAARLIDGKNMTPSFVQGEFRKALKTKYGDTYLYNNGHGMRKTFAQKYYDMVREKCDKKQVISKTNLVLGHGKNRGEQGIETYVANRW